MNRTLKKANSPEILKNLLISRPNLFNFILCYYFIGLDCISVWNQGNICCYKCPTLGYPSRTPPVQEVKGDRRFGQPATCNKSRDHNQDLWCSPLLLFLLAAVLQTFLWCLCSIYERLPKGRVWQGQGMRDWDRDRDREHGSHWYYAAGIKSE